ncbi:potassium uptake protein, TrkH family [Glycomyces harbinensis]|uniref:Potassium uptake protein, TrkH family n=1 Tax=Glycomyces harbinensis TaxID=58114 RepID=A0A1G6XQC6_9ACTN|nr:potassium uptake protein, TrkH family [Glycomyces harbinensis]
MPSAFLAFILVGTVLLMLPIATESGRAAPPLTALFTAVSAVCVTGLVVVDTATYWSGFGEVVITALIQVGGFGIIMAGTLLGVLVIGRLRLRGRLLAQTENSSVRLGDVRSLVGQIALMTATVEVVVAIALAARFRFHYEYGVGEAAWHGVFHSVAAFNNAGFGLEADSLMGFVADPVITLTISAAVIIGGIGFPVMVEVLRNTRRAMRPRTAGRRGARISWSLHTRITVLMTGVLLAVGFAAYAALEWRNPATLGPLGAGDKLLAAFTAGAQTRTAGFNNLDVSAFRPETLLATDALMFIGGGPAGTAGGIKVTTFAILAVVIWSEIRGEPDVAVFGRALPAETQRQALTVALLGVAAVAIGTAVIMLDTGFGLDQVLFEAVSAFATVGLSTGITPDLPPASQVAVIVLMFIGRVGTVAVAAALALRTRRRLYTHPEERPLVS